MTWVVGSEVARGATAVITRGEPGTVVKTLTRELPAVVMELEAAGTRAAIASGLPVPALREAALDASPPTLTFDYVEGRTYAVQSREVGPELVGRILAELQHRIRQVRNPDVIRVEEFLGFQLSQVDAPVRLRDAARRDLERLTAHADRVLCHMDLHDNNVIRSPAGPVVIDWMNASAAPAEADVARTRLVVGNEQFYTPEDAGIMSETLAAYIARTEELAPGLVGASRAWDRVIAVARLDEHVPQPERAAILARWGR